MRSEDFNLEGVSFYVEDARDFRESSDHFSSLKQIDQKLIENIRSSKRRAEIFKSRFLFYSLFPDHDVSKNSDGSLNYPPNISASLSHKDGIILFAKSESKILGIDVERDSVSIKLAKKIAPNEDLEALSKNSGFSKEQVLALVFSAKEAIYKAVYPTLKAPIGFEDVTLISIDLSSESSGVLKFSTQHNASILAKRPKFGVHYQKYFTSNPSLLLTFLKI